MPQLSPLDDPATYLQIAQQRYRDSMNPRAVNASREQQASTSGAPITALAPAASQTDPKTGISFAKAFTPQERTAQRAALLQKLQEMDAEDAQKSTGPTPSN